MNGVSCANFKIMFGESGKNRMPSHRLGFCRGFETLEDTLDMEDKRMLTNS